MSRQKQVMQVRGARGGHWVGDGFPVRTLFSYNELGEELSPFLMLDYAGPAKFEPTERRLGVGEHPHRGFETVTIVYNGEVSAPRLLGWWGTIGPGDVQWMTAASGVVHEEFHGRDFAARGGEFEMIQLWVNLPAKDKMSKPGYQGILSAQIPRVEFDGASVRVIAGELNGHAGPAKTFTPMQVWDVEFDSATTIDLKVPQGDSTAVVVRKGSLELVDDKQASRA